MDTPLLLRRAHVWMRVASSIFATSSSSKSVAHLDQSGLRFYWVSKISYICTMLFQGSIAIDTTPEMWDSGCRVLGDFNSNRAARSPHLRLKKDLVGGRAWTWL